MHSRRVAVRLALGRVETAGARLLCRESTGQLPPGFPDRRERDPAQPWKPPLTQHDRSTALNSPLLLLQARVSVLCFSPGGLFLGWSGDGLLGDTGSSVICRSPRQSGNLVHVGLDVQGHRPEEKQGQGSQRSPDHPISRDPSDHTSETCLGPHISGKSGLQRLLGTRLHVGLEPGAAVSTGFPPMSLHKRLHQDILGLLVI